MRLLTFLRFMRQILKKGPADLDWIQRQGLLSVKLAQIFALRSDLLSVEKCQQLQTKGLGGFLFLQIRTLPTFWA